MDLPEPWKRWDFKDVWKVMRGRGWKYQSTPFGENAYFAPYEGDKNLLQRDIDYFDSRGMMKFAFENELYEPEEGESEEEEEMQVELEKEESEEEAADEEDEEEEVSSGEAQSDMDMEEQAEEASPEKHVKITWNLLKSWGWAHKHGGPALGSGYVYLRPGAEYKKGDEDGDRLNREFFLNEAHAIAWAEKWGVDGEERLGHLKEAADASSPWRPASVRPEHRARRRPDLGVGGAAADQSSVGMTAKSSKGSSAGKTGKAGKASMKRKQAKLVRPPAPSSWSWTDVWSELQYKSWSKKAGEGDVSYYY